MNNTNPLYLLQEVSVQTYKKAVDNVIKKKGSLDTCGRILKYAKKSAKRNNGKSLLRDKGAVQALKNDMVRNQGLEHSTTKLVGGVKKLYNA